MINKACVVINRVHEEGRQILYFDPENPLIEIFFLKVSSPYIILNYFIFLEFLDPENDESTHMNLLSRS